MTVLRKQKTIIKRELSEIATQEDQKILHEAECNKMLASLSEKLELANKKVKKAKFNREGELKKIDSKIEKKQKEVKKFEDQIHQILKECGNPSINATCLL